MILGEWLRVQMKHVGSFVTTFLRPFSTKLAQLERRLVVNDITARASRAYGSCPTRLRLVISLLLVMVLGVSEMWGQTDYSGVYYIGSVGYDGNPNNTNNYYLCPTEGWAFFVSDDANPGTVTGSDNGKPFLTTYRCKTNDYHSGDSKDAVWNIEKAVNPNYYYIKHTNTGRYLVSNGAICSNPDRAFTKCLTHCDSNKENK